jgi:toxin secretion/phage lysis holin
VDKSTSFVGVITGFIAFLFGTNNTNITMLYIMLTLMGIDLLIGILTSVYNNNFDRKVLWKGFIKKVIEIIIVSAMYQIDKVNMFDGTLMLERITVYAFIGYEVTSIIGNAKKAGIKLPKKITDATEKIDTNTANDVTTISQQSTANISNSNDIRSTVSDIIKSVTSKGEK